MSHHRAGGEDDSATGNIACSCKIWLLEICEPFNNLLWLCVGKKESDLAFYSLRFNSEAIGSDGGEETNLGEFMETQAVLFLC